MDDLKLICRVCETKDELIYLFAPENDDFLAMLRFFVKIDIDEEDFLPNCICAICSSRLQHAYIFKRQCEATDRKLRLAYLSNVNEIIDIKSNPSEPANFEYNKTDESQWKDKELIENQTVLKIELLDPGIFEYNKDTSQSQCKDKLIASDNELLETDIIDDCHSDIEEISSVNDVEEFITENTAMKAGQNPLEDASKGDALLDETTSDKLIVFTSENLEQDIEYIDENFDHFISSENIEGEKILAPNEMKVICGFFLGEAERRGEPGVKETDKIMFRKLGNPRIYSSQKKSIKHFVCDTCSQVFTNYKEINEHKRSHGRKRFQCSVCSKWFAKNYKLKLHSKIHGDKSKHPCTLCDRKYSTANNLQRHVRSFHNKEREHACEICFRRFARLAELHQHKYVHTDERNFACDQCGKTFKSSLAVYAHKKLHDPVSQQKQRAKGVRRQKRTYHFVCEFCGKSTTNRTSHDTHLRTHTGEKPYECRICGKRFHIKQSLKKHILTHTDIRPYSCNLCDATFRQISHLKTHQNFHLGLKPYSCNICGKSFSGSGTLKIHKRTHTGEKPYHCTDCDRRFIDTNALKRHKLTHIRKTYIPDEERKVKVGRNEMFDSVVS